MTITDKQAMADALYDWLSGLMPNGEMLNAAVACDYAGQQRFKRALADKLAALEAAEASRACGTCGGSGVSDYVRHGPGEEDVERIRCVDCEGFGTSASAEVRHSEIVALATKVVGYWADGEMVDGYSSAMIDLEAALSAAPSSAEQPAAHGVVFATVREADDDTLHVECRFASGEKYAAVHVATEKPELAQWIAAALSAPGAPEADDWRSVLADVVQFVKRPADGHDDGELMLDAIARADALLASAAPSVAPVYQVRVLGVREWSECESKEEFDRFATKRLYESRVLYTTPPADARDGGWNFDMSAAPRDGTILELLIAADDDRCCPIDDSCGPTWTIGCNSFDHDDIDAWQFAGWNWEQDLFVQGDGNPVAWRRCRPQDIDRAMGGG